VSGPARASHPPLADQIARASAWALVGFCVLEVALARGSRAAATLLLSVDSDLLRVLEAAGARVGGFAAEGILASAAAALAARIAADVRDLGVAATATACAILAAGAWVVVGAPHADARTLWWPSAAGAALAFGLLLARPAPAAGFAALLQGGIAAYAVWAAIVATARAPVAWLDKSSEVAILCGVAGTGFAAGGRSRVRGALAAALLLAAGAGAVAAPEAAHALVRHLSAFGNSGLPSVVVAGLAAAAAAGAVHASGRVDVFAPLVAALTCARRPEARMVAALLASSALLAIALGRRARSP
jgi:hypothetical protein